MMTPTSPLPLVDLVIRGARITTFADPAQAPEEVQAVAVAQGRIVAVGTDAEIAPLEALAARVIDLAGRRMIPGLNDAHIHAVRAGNSWNRSMHWEDIRSLDEALGRVRDEASRRGPGAWISVIGGWHASQLLEGRGPTRAELDAAAPANPVYVQELYDRGVLNTAGLRACGFDDGVADPPRGRLHRDDAGALTGELHGVGAFAVPTALALQSAPGDAEAGVRAMSAEFARHGLTGFVDGGGLLMTPRDYDPIHAVGRAGDLGVRARLFLSAWTRGAEVADIAALTALVQPGSGDEMVRIVGIGEIPHLGCHDMEGLDPFTVPTTAREELTEIVRICARRGWRMSIHAVLDSTLRVVLDAWEQVEAEQGGVAGRGWSIVHADDASRASLERVARLGAGVLVQNRLLLKGGDYVGVWGAAATAAAPPLADLRELGIVIGAGTDATRANWFAPWASVWWLVTGGTLDGNGTRAVAHRLTRADALAAYTRDAAWFTGEQGNRGRIAPGYDADFCVPTLDPFACTDDDLRDLRSDLTIMAGRVTHDAGVFAG